MNNLLTCILLLISGSLIAQVEFEFDQVIPLPENINSIYEESVPIYDPDNYRLYFIKTRNDVVTSGLQFLPPVNPIIQFQKPEFIFHYLY